MQESMNTEATSVEKKHILSYFKNFSFKGALIGVGIFLLFVYILGVIMPMDEIEYLQEVNKVFEEVGSAVITVQDLSLNYANTPAKAEILSDVFSDLENAREELESMDPPEEYKQLHQQAIDVVNSFLFYLQNEIDGIENQDIHLIAIGIKGRNETMNQYNFVLQELQLASFEEDCPECKD